MPTPHRRLGLCLLLCLTVAGLSGGLATTAGAATAPTTFAPFRGAGTGYTYTFAKPVRSTRPGIVQFQFPGTLQVSSVRAPLYSLVSVFVLFVGVEVTLAVGRRAGR